MIVLASHLFHVHLRFIDSLGHVSDGRDSTGVCLYLFLNSCLLNRISDFLNQNSEIGILTEFSRVMQILRKFVVT